MATELTGTKAAPRLLIVGYGNTLRGDDGLGPHVIARLERSRLPHGVRTRTVTQLTPELSEELAEVEAAVIVDASTRTDVAVCIRPVTPRLNDEAVTHVCSVESLLELARDVYGNVPSAWLISVSGRDFAFHEGLSPTARSNADAAVRQIEQLMNDTVRKSP